jgi:hypothetical protein
LQKFPSDGDKGVIRANGFSIARIH